MNSAAASTEPVRVPVAGENPYEVVIGRGLLGELPTMLGSGVTQVAILAPRALRIPADALAEDLRSEGLGVISLEVPDGEEAKDAAVAAFCWSALAQSGFTRSDAIVGFGGGATTDLAGFVAATWLRGIRVVQVPTTLLGMVDAAVGGKTGINVPEGKNLVGAFHSPAGVLCDLTALETLPRHDYVAGLAEVIKAGFIADPGILTLVEGDPEAATSPAGPHTAELIERAVRVKAEVVGGDLRERTTRAGERIGREMLNYGHTLGHAVEKVERYSWRHGAAVSVGMVFVAELAALAGRLAPDLVDRHRSILTSVGLPVTYRQDRWPALYDAMRVDKKARGELLRFVVLDDLAAPALLEGPDPSLLAAAYSALEPPVGGS